MKLSRLSGPLRGLVNCSIYQLLAKYIIAAAYIITLDIKRVNVCVLIQVYNFDMNKDIAKPSIDEMGTYTEKLVNSKRIQISGVIVMSWKIIRIDL